jgi:hypothetical protein
VDRVVDSCSRRVAPAVNHTFDSKAIPHFDIQKMETTFMFVFLLVVKQFAHISNVAHNLFFLLCLKLMEYFCYVYMLFPVPTFYGLCMRHTFFWEEY